MTLYNNFVGIDISKKDFVVAIYGMTKTMTYENHIIGWQNFVEENKTILSTAFVVIETTDGYEIGVLSI
ncbi:hypothetical protein [Candidatus Trichorickettsia mobilis]|jgi:transposase|uniref:hypothetical protein n=1 Tax=Candidatus Trichorickettsia mobilis TaxID=1346319 RepID=UPI00293020E6|nr:hypothetical protein [Candidatus Trichorickettsia mobilis]